MYGAEHADRSDVETALNPLARRFAYCGIPGTGVTTKLVSNLLSNAVHVANLEALVIAERARLDIGTVLEVLRSTAAHSTRESPPS
jgi:3-hydroxyisobutyrate dehydrogenase-like beta-hydroxyacid dehydrogenase